MPECHWCEKEIVGEGIKLSTKKKHGEKSILVCNEKCKKEYKEWQEEFNKNFKEKIIENKELHEKMADVVSTYFKMPTGSKVITESLANEMAELWKKELGLDDD